MLALWVTNRERHRRFIDAELLPAWGLRHVATLYWLKVTNDGQLVSPLVLLCHYYAPYKILLLTKNSGHKRMPCWYRGSTVEGDKHTQETHDIIVTLRGSTHFKDLNFSMVNCQIELGL